MQKATYDRSHVELLEIDLGLFWTSPNRHADHRENYPLLNFPELKIVMIVIPRLMSYLKRLNPLKTQKNRL